VLGIAARSTSPDAWLAEATAHWRERWHDARLCSTTSESST
jgi:hypothetical protein